MNAPAASGDAEAGVRAATINGEPGDGAAEREHADDRAQRYALPARVVLGEPSATALTRR